VSGICNVRENVCLQAIANVCDTAPYATQAVSRLNERSAELCPMLTHKTAGVHCSQAVVGAREEKRNGTHKVRSGCPVAHFNEWEASVPLSDVSDLNLDFESNCDSRAVFSVDNFCTDYVSLSNKDIPVYNDSIGNNRALTLNNGALYKSATCCNVELSFDEDCVCLDSAVCHDGHDDNISDIFVRPIDVSIDNDVCSDNIECHFNVNDVVPGCHFFAESSMSNDVLNHNDSVMGNDSDLCDTGTDFHNNAMDGNTCLVQGDHVTRDDVDICNKYAIFHGDNVCLKKAVCSDHGSCVSDIHSEDGHADGFGYENSHLLCDRNYEPFRESLFGAPGLSDSSSDNDESIVHGNNTYAPVNRGNKNMPFRFMLWNVNGLIPKIFDNDFVSFCTSFDFVCFVETFTFSFDIDIFVGFKAFCQPATKLSVFGRPSGGVVCLIKNELAPFIKQIKVVKGNFLLFDIDKDLFGLSKNVLYVCAYVPPDGSNYYSFLETDIDGISMLEDCLVDQMLDGDHLLILSGDLNARTADISQSINTELDMFDSLRECGPVNSDRKSQDKSLTKYGKALLDMCTALDLCILNGMCYGDLDGRFTYLCDTGGSVIDYFLMSNELFACFQENFSLHVLDRIESNHMPVSLSFSYPSNNLTSKTDVENFTLEEFVWNPERHLQYSEALKSDEIIKLLDTAIRLTDSDINLALGFFNECIKQAACCMKKQKFVSKKGNQQTWFDSECKNARKALRKCLKRFRRTLTNEDRFSFCKARREYKNMLLYKRKQYNSLMVDKLLKSIDTQREFWDTVRKIIPKRTYTRNNISIDEWFVHFQSLLNKDTANNLCIENETIDDQEHDERFFNRPISEEEILFALHKLKSRKAAGPDRIIGELLKNASQFVVPFFLKFLNVLFDKGIYPEQWTESVILPLFKKGDVNNPGNYRGISLCDVSSKVYGIIINKRLQEWVTENNSTGEYQAGFKKGYSTIDHLFTLLACVEKQFSHNRKLYVAFIDFEKCFDSINRNLLWPILLKNDIRGKLFKCIRSMYTCVKARVRCNYGITQYINCSLGVKQGDICSPVLFSLFINELALDVLKGGKHGVTFGLDAFELFILLLADDVVLLSETVIGLQTQLRNLHKSASALCLKVNLEKSNIVVFRKGGYLAAREKWLYDGNILPVVNAYKYLGIFFSTRLSFVFACNNIASKAKRALLCIMQRLRIYNNNSFDVFIKLFDSQIQPIMSYGSEIWGLEKAAIQCEKVHLFAIKKFLLVDRRTPNDLVYNELNRYPITINFIVNCIKYWLKLLKMDDSRIPKKAYKLLYNLDLKGKETWVTKVRNCLFRHGYGFVWLNEGVGNDKLFLRTFKERLVDCRWQECDYHINNSKRFDVYNSFCDRNHLTPLYLKLDMDKQMKYIMTRFRFGISDLAVHFYRYRNSTPIQRLCQLCKEAEETELHFVLCCPFFNNLRKALIAPKYFRQPSAFRLAILIATKHEATLRKLALFLYKAFKARSIALS
jgi:hypothetical protein